VSLLPDDPLVRWVFWFVIVVSVIVPVVLALVLMIAQ
jgi:hypothetical protein